MCWTQSYVYLQLYNEAFYAALRKHLAEAQLATAEMAFAWRAFNFDTTTRNILGLPTGSSRPGKLQHSRTMIHRYPWSFVLDFGWMGFLVKLWPNFSFPHQYLLIMLKSCLTMFVRQFIQCTFLSSGVSTQCSLFGVEYPLTYLCECSLFGIAWAIFRENLPWLTYASQEEFHQSHPQKRPRWVVILRRCPKGFWNNSVHPSFQCNIVILCY